MTSNFVRLIAGPWEMPLFDGRLRVIALELFEDRLVLYWHVYPLPTHNRPNVGATGEQHAAESAGSGAQPSEKGGLWLSRLLAAEMELADDAGQRYTATSGGGGGTSDERWGARVFVPGLSQTAQLVRLRFQGGEVTVPIT